MTDSPAFDTASFRDTLTDEGAFSPAQAKALSRALNGATSHMPSRDSLAAFRAEMRTTLAERLNDQTWKVVQIVGAAVVLNLVAVIGTGVALYNALKS